MDGRNAWTPWRSQWLERKVSYQLRQDHIPHWARTVVEPPTQNGLSHLWQLARSICYLCIIKRCPHSVFFKIKYQSGSFYKFTDTIIYWWEIRLHHLKNKSVKWCEPRWYPLIKKTAGFSCQRIRQPLYPHCSSSMDKFLSCLGNTEKPGASAGFRLQHVLVLSSGLWRVIVFHKNGSGERLD